MYQQQIWYPWNHAWWNFTSMADSYVEEFLRSSAIVTETIVVSVCGSLHLFCSFSYKLYKVSINNRLNNLFSVFFIILCIYVFGFFLITIHWWKSVTLLEVAEILFGIYLQNPTGLFHGGNKTSRKMVWSNISENNSAIILFFHDLRCEMLRQTYSNLTVSANGLKQW